MHLSQSVGLWQGRGGIQKIALFGKIPTLYYGKNSSNKQRETSVHHYFKTWRSVNPENVQSFFNCSRKNHQALWCNWLSWGPPQNRKTQSYLCCRISSLEFIRVRVTSLRNYSPNKCFTEFKLNETSQHQLFRGDYMNQAFMDELLQRNNNKRTPIRIKDLLWPRNTSNGH